MSSAEERMNYQYVEVAYFQDEGKVLGLRVLNESVEKILCKLGIDYTNCQIGINGSVVDMDYMVKTGDRIEVYPVLRVDPKVKRRRLVESRKNNRRNKDDIG